VADTERTLLCEVITPERVVYRDEARMVVAPTIDGEVGIMPLHAPLVSVLKPGEIRIRRGKDEVEWAAVSGGYLQVHEDKVIVLADDAAMAGQIDVEAARQAQQRVQARLDESGERDEQDVDRLERDLRWCEVQLQVAKKSDE
jgi:F-type H+-transporting ATPase subunit epsilon